MDKRLIQVDDDQHLDLVVLVAAELNMMRERQANTASGIWDDRVRSMERLQEALREAAWI
jgi:hypothetical protein